MPEILRFAPRLIQHGIASSVPTVRFLASVQNSQTANYGVTDISYFQVYDFELTAASSSGPTDRSDLMLLDHNYFTRVDSRDPSNNLLWEITIGTNITVPHSNASYRVRLMSEPAIFTGNSFPYFAITDPDFTTIQENIPSTDDIWQLNEDGSNYDLVFPFDFNEALGDNQDTISAHIHHSSWNGLITVDFHVRDSDAVQLRFPDTVDGFGSVPYIPPFTGWDRRPASRGRPVLDMRTGTPAFAEDLVEDGYKPGIWTSAKNWDPVDPRDVAPVEFPENEGQKDDDVPV